MRVDHFLLQAAAVQVSEHIVNCEDEYERHS